MSTREQLHQAIDHYHELLHQAPNDLGLVINLAWGYERAGQYPESIQQFRRAIEFNPNDYNAHYGLALAYMGNGQLQQAWSEFQRAGELVADSTDRAAIVIVLKQIDAITRRLSGQQTA